MQNMVKLSKNHKSLKNCNIETKSDSCLGCPTSSLHVYQIWQQSANSEKLAKLSKLCQSKCLKELSMSLKHGVPSIIPPSFRRIQRKCGKETVFEITYLNNDKIAKFLLIENQKKTFNHFEELDPTYHDAKLCRDHIKM